MGSSMSKVHELLISLNMYFGVMFLFMASFLVLSEVMLPYFFNWFAVVWHEILL